MIAIRKPGISKFVIPLAFLLGISAPGSAGITVDRVLARVNGDPIMMSQLAEFMAAARPDASLTRDEARKIGLDRLIEESLVVFAAERANMTVDDASIRAQAKAQVDSLRQEAGGTEAFHEGLKREALTEEELKEIYEVRLRRQALYFRMIHSKRNEIEERASVNSADVENLYHRDKDQLAEALVRWIEYPAQEKPGPVRDQMETKARRAKARLDAGKTFAQAAKDTGGKLVADVQTHPDGGPLRVLRRDLPVALAEEAFTRGESDWGKPQFAALQGGFYVYQVDEIKVPDLAQERDKLRRDLGRAKVDEEMKAWMAGLRSEAVIEMAEAP